MHGVGGLYMAFQPLRVKAPLIEERGELPVLPRLSVADNVLYSLLHLKIRRP